jgi:RNA polymerase sigma factor (sigma-70 family)
MEKTIGISDLNRLSEKDLVEMLKESNDALTFVYNKHKAYCFNFMKTMFDDMDEINDIYHDAIVAFYEKVQNPSFSLSCSIQTYLNSVCRNQVLLRLKKRNKQAFMRINTGDEDFLESISDLVDESVLIKNDRISVLEEILTEMKIGASKCYEILTRFWFENQSMAKIAYYMEYTNADNAKNQKSRCQEKLTKELFKRL